MRCIHGYDGCRALNRRVAVFVTSWSPLFPSTTGLEPSGERDGGGGVCLSVVLCLLLLGSDGVLFEA